MPRFAKVVATARHLPKERVTNEDLKARLAPLGLAENIDKLEETSGIRQRFYAPADFATSDLALPAAKEALARAGRRPEEVDLLLVGTDTPDYLTPATSTVLQHKLGATRAGTFDVGCACASFPTAMATAAGLIAVNPSIRTVLVVGAYLMHRLADPNDPVVFFYGDGAGAAVLEAGEEPGFLSAAFRADGSYAERWGIFAGGTKEPATVEAVEAGRTRVRLLERYPPEVNEEGWPVLFSEVAERGGFTVDDVDLAIFTQVRKPTIEKVADRLGLSRERAHTVMEHFGYTGSACIPMALDDAIEQGKLKDGGLVVLLGSGVGYNQAACAFRMG